MATTAVLYSLLAMSNAVCPESSLNALDAPVFIETQNVMNFSAALQRNWDFDGVFRKKCAFLSLYMQ